MTNPRDGDIADRSLTKENAPALLGRLTLPEMAKRVRQCDKIDALEALINACQDQARRAPLWGDTWRFGHFSRPQLDKLTELASDQIDDINRDRLSTLRERSFLDNLIPQSKKETNDGQARQGTFRRQRRQRRSASTDGTDGADGI
jgi:hypothetical protein